MANEGLELLRDLLKGATNEVENPPHGDEYQSISQPPLNAGGGQDIVPPPPGGGGGYGGGMDPWQSSVETRLGSLERKLERVDERLGGVETNVATLMERVAHLPSSTKLYTTAVAIVIALTAAITFSEKLHGLLH